jgi:hypothetical protein
MTLWKFVEKKQVIRFAISLVSYFIFNSLVYGQNISSGMFESVVNSDDEKNTLPLTILGYQNEGEDNQEVFFVLIGSVVHKTYDCTSEKLNSLLGLPQSQIHKRSINGLIDEFKVKLGTELSCDPATTLGANWSTRILITEVSGERRLYIPSNKKNSIYYSVSARCAKDFIEVAFKTGLAVKIVEQKPVGEIQKIVCKPRYSFRYPYYYFINKLPVAENGSLSYQVVIVDTESNSKSSLTFCKIDGIYLDSSNIDATVSELEEIFGSLKLDYGSTRSIANNEKSCIDLKTNGTNNDNNITKLKVVLNDQGAKTYGSETSDIYVDESCRGVMSKKTHNIVMEKPSSNKYEWRDQVLSGIDSKAFHIDAFSCLSEENPCVVDLEDVRNTQAVFEYTMTAFQNLLNGEHTLTKECKQRGSKRLDILFPSRAVILPDQIRNSLSLNNTVFANDVRFAPSSSGRTELIFKEPFDSNVAYLIRVGSEKNLILDDVDIKIDHTNSARKINSLFEIERGGLFFNGILKVKAKSIKGSVISMNKSEFICINCTIETESLDREITMISLIDSKAFCYNCKLQSNKSLFFLKSSDIVLFKPDLRGNEIFEFNDYNQAGKSPSFAYIDSMTITASEGYKNFVQFKSMAKDNMNIVCRTESCEFVYDSGTVGNSVFIRGDGYVNILGDIVPKPEDVHIDDVLRCGINSSSKLFYKNINYCKKTQ